MKNVRDKIKYRSINTLNNLKRHYIAQGTNIQPICISHMIQLNSSRIKSPCHKNSSPKKKKEKKIHIKKIEYFKKINIPNKKSNTLNKISYNKRDTLSPYHTVPPIPSK